MQLISMNTNICDPEKCPISEQCPVGPTPNIVCELKERYQMTITEDIHSVFPKLKEDPATQLRIKYMLIPLFEQLLHVKMAYAINSQIILGKIVNPLLREVRQIINEINKTLNCIDDTKPADRVKNLESANTGNSYYDMLFTEGVATVETPVGITQNH